ncbi:MAG: hypothetical protein COC05_00635 [Gammaproteobacteria bacterium]|nr:MAG: hypothetical protein COC05_00635 [Gammaproteobacteria bacterium]
MFKCLFLVVTIIGLAMSPVMAGEGPIKVVVAVPFQDEKKIQKNVLEECVTLGDKLSNFTSSYSKKAGIDIELVESLPSPESGERFLKIEIVNAISQGNAFTGHAKFVAIEGTLYENGEVAGSFSGARSSGGGVFGGYKGACAILGRCVKTLGKDIAGWLKSPGVDSRIGE